MAVHSQLIDYRYAPAGKARGFSLAFLKDKTAPEHSTTFEEFMAGVIKDRPANIDAFYDGNVKTFFDSVTDLRDFCRNVVFLAEEKAKPELLAKVKVISFLTKGMISDAKITYTKDFEQFMSSRPKKMNIDSSDDESESKELGIYHVIKHIVTCDLEIITIALKIYQSVIQS